MSKDSFDYISRMTSPQPENNPAAPPGEDNLMVVNNGSPSTVAEHPEQATTPGTNTEASRAPGADVPVVTKATKKQTTRMPVGLALTGAFVLGWLALVGPTLPAVAPDATAQAALGTGTARNAVPDAFFAQARNDQQAAADYMAKHGTLDDFTLDGDVRVAAAGSMMFATRLIDGVCNVYEFSGAAGSEPMKGEAADCTDEAIDALQLKLDAVAAETAAAEQTAAGESFARAAASVSGYALGNWVDSQPSVTGMNGEIAEGVIVVSTHGTYLVARTGEAAGCRVANIGVDGTVSEPTPCR